MITFLHPGGDLKEEGLDNDSNEAASDVSFCSHLFVRL